jgi:hypothetical protein
MLKTKTMWQIVAAATGQAKKLYQKNKGGRDSLPSHGENWQLANVQFI